MKKIFIIHGFEGMPNGGWRPWLMDQLGRQDIYACALAMPTPFDPEVDEWVAEITRQIEANTEDEIYLVGHSLGATAILRYLESDSAKNVSGAVLVSGPVSKNDNKKIASFLDKDFNFKKIKTRSKKFTIIHGDNDPFVPVSDAEMIASELEGELIIIENGGHLNGSAGWDKLPQCLDTLNKMLSK
jgi:uncharacterized protein